MMEILAVLGLPLAGGALLALWGHEKWAPELNSMVSFCTFAASILLAWKVLVSGSMVVLNEQFFIDSFNVFLVVLTAFVAFTTTLFSRPYMRNEAILSALSNYQLRLYHSMYQVFCFTMLLALTTNNLGILWGAM